MRKHNSLGNQYQNANQKKNKEMFKNRINMFKISYSYSRIYIHIQDFILIQGWGHSKCTFTPEGEGGEGRQTKRTRGRGLFKKLYVWPILFTLAIFFFFLLAVLRKSGDKHNPFYLVNVLVRSLISFQNTFKMFTR